MVTHKILHSGQPKPYQDSIYLYEITSDESEEKTLEYCKKLHHATHRDDNACFNGSSSFPYGLDSYYKFKREKDGVYHYEVCEPYAG